MTLNFEIWSRADLVSNKLVLASAFGSSLFVVIPYIANLVIATRIKAIVGGNESARTYFESRTPIFTAFVVLVGGAYPALSLVSSNIFGLSILNCGLTRFELRRLSKIKVFNSVVLENVPQLIFQALYAFAIGGVTETVAFATTASILSVIATLLSFLIDRRDGAVTVVQYFLAMRCDRDVDVSPSPPQSPSADGMSSTMFNSRVTSVSYPSSALEIGGNDLRRAEKFKILCNRGRTRALSFALAALWEIDPKRLEIGKTTMTKNGARTHIVHFLYANELESRDDEEMALSKVQKMYGESNAEVSHIFREHFELGADFSVHFEAAKHALRREDSADANRNAHLLREVSKLVATDEAFKEEVIRLMAETRAETGGTTDVTGKGAEMEMVKINE